MSRVSHESQSLFTESAGGAVECLGLTFPSEDARRAHFLEKLKAKLKDPEFRKTEGFPIGSDEDILRLSDPPYFTVCPNPFVEDFVRFYGTPYQSAVHYDRAPFAVDVSEGKTDPIYTAHSYHTKVPHRAIMWYILHYTQPGDVVLDGFCGTGMTGVAAQLCAAPPSDMKKQIDDELPEVQWGARRPLLVDLSPFATFIAHNYNTPVDAVNFAAECESAIAEVEAELAWAYDFDPKHPHAKRITLTVWSDVFICSECGADLVYWGNGIKRVQGEIDPMKCPHCKAQIPKATAVHKTATLFDPILRHPITQPLQVPVIVRGEKHERLGLPFDAEIVGKCLQQVARFPLPANQMMFRDEPWGDIYRAGYHAGITHTHHFYNPRQLLVLSALWSRFRQSSLGRRLQLVLTSFALRNGFRGNRFVINKHNPNGRINGPLTNCLYFPSLLAEQNLFDLARSKSKDLTTALRNLNSIPGIYCLSTQSSTDLRFIPNNSVDYVFVDPPFGANIMYSEMNFVVESWLGAITNNHDEAIVNETQGKDIERYGSLVLKCLQQFNRVLKPGRWLTMVFHNSQSSVWTSIQNALASAGFVVADVRTLDKQKGTVYQEYYVTGTTKQDLVISAYKPHTELEQRFEIEKGTEEGVWDFVRTHLHQLPTAAARSGILDVIGERQAYLLFDRMVAFHVQRNVGVPISFGDFVAGLSQRFPGREGMYFLPDQVAEYDQQRMKASEVRQLEIFVRNEKSAIQWLRQQLQDKPQTFQEIHPQFMREIAGWEKHESPVELRDLLEQNFLLYEGQGEVPSQIHRYLSTNFHDLRKLPKDAPALRAKAKDRYYVPDPTKEADVQKSREKALLREFGEYRELKQKKLKVFRLEVIRTGFRWAWQQNDYNAILDVAEKIPEDVLQEDAMLLMWYTNSLIRAGRGA